MLRRSRLPLLGIMVGLLTGMLLLVVISQGRPHSIASNSDSGLSIMVKELEADWVTDLKDLRFADPKKHLLIIARTGVISAEELSIISSFLSNGGVVLAYGSDHFLKSIATHLNVNVTFQGAVLDPVFNVGSRRLIVATSSLCNKDINLTLYAPYTIVESLPSWKTMATSSPISFLDLNKNGFYDVGEPIGSFPVATEVIVGEGVLLIVFSDYLLENFLYEFNKGFLDCIRSDRHIIVDQSEVRRDPLEYSKLVIQSSRGRIYLLLLILVLLTVSYYVLTNKP